MTMRYICTFFLSFFSLLVLAQENIELISLGRKVNSSHHEAGPIISADGSKLYFWIKDHPDNTFGREGSQDIWYTERDESGEWKEPVHLDKPLNEHRSNQVFTVFPDGKTLLIMGGNGKNDKGFSFAYKSGDTWSSTQELDVDDFKKMNQGRFYGGCMDSDQKVLILYFSEKENSALSDLYVSFRESGNKWTRPVKLGAPINTGRDEFAPFMGPDNKTLYFSSSRKDMGLGGADIYKSKRLDDSWMKWSKPVNMKAPINTRGFDAYFSIDEEGNIFTTSAGPKIDGGSLDIFTLKPKEPELKLLATVMNSKTQQTLNSNVIFKGTKNKLDTTLNTNEEGRFQLVLMKQGEYSVSINSKGFEPLEQKIKIPSFEEDTTFMVDFSLKPIPAKPIIAFTVFNKKNNEKIDAELTFQLKGDRSQTVTTENGYYETFVDKKGKYLVDASAEGFLNASDSIDISTLSDPIFADKKIYLSPIEVGATVRLEHIYFDFAKASLRQESFTELNKVVKFMNDNESVSIEIGGHTDSKGSDEYNLNLSQSRAESVMNYLVENGIDSNRVSAKGYGESQPETTNDTEEGRAQNRRVVFTILSN